MGKVYEYTFIQRRSADGRWAHKTILNIIRHCEPIQQIIKIHEPKLTSLKGETGIHSYNNCWRHRYPTVHNEQTIRWKVRKQDLTR